VVLGKIWYFGIMEHGIQQKYTVFRNTERVISKNMHGILEDYILVYVLNKLVIQMCLI
jgi:hypothetical protein